jgi:small subunit ribosomal protein S5
MIRPAAAGRGIVAGGPIRSILELAGVKDVVSKSLGSNTKINTSKATIDALKQQKSLSHIAELRGKKEEEIK